MRYNSFMNRSEKIKRIAYITFFAAASGYFLYSGFSTLFKENELRPELTVPSK